MTKKYVYDFSEGNKDMRNLLGGKGANLAEMTCLGLSVPPGFTITTEACNRYYDENESLWPELLEEVEMHIKETEKKLNKKFSDENNPLLFSVRSGAVFSMPGMMDTILNLGLNDKSVIGLANSTKNERFAYDSYRRFIQMFADVAMDIPKVHFETALEQMKEDKKVDLDNELTAEDLKKLVDIYKKIYVEETGNEFPQDPMVQLKYSIEAVFRSWNNPRANIYRKLHNIDNTLGTAVNIQSMVFGNMGDTSGTGVAFSRNPATGENKLFGEYLINAQGEDVVAGIRTPEHISTLHDVMPEVYDEFLNTANKLEEHYKDMQDLEFTIENGKLFILQTRSGKRTTQAALNIVVDLVNEGLISKEEAVMRIEPDSLNQLLHPNFDPEQLKNAQLISKGLAASPGAASGKIYFNAEEAVEAAKKGDKVILVRQETSPEDIEGMISAEGILTARGGMTSHAAVVARGMGKCCVAGASEVVVDEAQKIMRSNNFVLTEGDVISLNGNDGSIYFGNVDKVEPELSGNFEIFMNWVDEIRNMKVRTNADSPKDAKQALKFGAEGIGLTRTEHMFFSDERIPAVREMILSKTTEQRKIALDKIRPMQENDFYEIYKVMEDLPVTIRLLDPPLHEFLPTNKKDIEKLAKDMGLSYDEVNDTVQDLHEVNPMLGHRGCRLAVTYPEIYRMQARAIITAALRHKKEGRNIVPEIMIPLVGDVKELIYVKNEIIDEINTIFEEYSDKVEYLIGTMIEVPRAALLADEIAEEADFFSFGTNDMTQMAFGFSRDDAGKFLGEYEEKDIYPTSPFESLDQKGVGKLLEIAVEKGLKTNKNLHLGICGEHGGEPSSIEFCYNLGLDYVSCSPYRVPIARLTLAQATVKKQNIDTGHIDK
ncbi:pyruvate, phosphate dikinase [Miniphocaeibacter halophilus]|uniref:Pyruvate, phosphate dikinase n=1 Tax=Miniphocaeibacter halophilus TaxID=2931922 RepID=A0AC61MT07_9FIRM|nr:pyruvate, phosphate dikinase [Miniphocaeibacter halophilus]QQK07576.1 pyruvate, phosphate dikinase [Miniphocaeibacter halophilus]